MNRLSVLICGLLLGVVCISCSEKSEEEEFSNWENRNGAYLDSIAKVAKANSDGSWTIYKAYTLGDSTAIYNGHNDRFIFVKKLEHGNGAMHPLFSDSVRVHYSGRLIPTKTYVNGYCFDKSYVSDTLNVKTDVPALFGVKGNIVGFATALQYMVEGDKWLVYIPYQLGYGEQDAQSIPAYSTLIFEMTLAKIYRQGEYLSTEWH